MTLYIFVLYDVGIALGILLTWQQLVTGTARQFCFAALVATTALATGGLLHTAAMSLGLYFGWGAELAYVNLKRKG